MSMATGEPSVSPARSPESHSMWSRSIFIRAPRPYPCIRRASSRSTHSAETGSPAGRPSTMVTSALPCDSPAVENRSMMIGSFREVRHSPDSNERARPAPGSFCFGRLRSMSSLGRDAVVDDPGGDQDDQVTPVFFAVTVAEQLADDRQAGEQRNTGPGVGDFGDGQTTDHRGLAVVHQKLV